MSCSYELKNFLELECLVQLEAGEARCAMASVIPPHVLGYDLVIA